MAKCCQNNHRIDIGGEIEKHEVQDDEQHDKRHHGNNFATALETQQVVRHCQDQGVSGPKPRVPETNQLKKRNGIDENGKSSDATHNRTSISGMKTATNKPLTGINVEQHEKIIHDIGDLDTTRKEKSKQTREILDIRDVDTLRQEGKTQTKTSTNLTNIKSPTRRRKDKDQHHKFIQLERIRKGVHQGTKNSHQ